MLDSTYDQYKRFITYSMMEFGCQICLTVDLTFVSKSEVVISKTCRLIQLLNQEPIHEFYGHKLLIRLTFFNGVKISFFLCSEDLMLSLHGTLKSVKDIPHILKVLLLLKFFFIILFLIILRRCSFIMFGTTMVCCSNWSFFVIHE